MQLCVICLGFFQRGNVGVSIFPECEEILVRRSRVRTVMLRRVRSGEAELGKRVVHGKWLDRLQGKLGDP